MLLHRGFSHIGGCQVTANLLYGVSLRSSAFSSVFRLRHDVRREMSHYVLLRESVWQRICAPMCACACLPAPSTGANALGRSFPSILAEECSILKY